jgi:hypothetical protein
MGIVYSYLYDTNVAHLDEDQEQPKSPPSDSNYTILYPQHEKEYLQQLEAEAKKQAAAFKFIGTYPPEVWARMSPR